MLAFIGLALCIGGLAMSYFVSVGWLSMTLVGCVVLSANLDHTHIINTIKYRYYR